jgi:hypothetical protein
VKLVFRRLLACLFVTLSAHAGILISRSDQGLQFTDAASLLFNGKEKVLSLGARPAAAGQLSKLPAAHLSAALLKDRDSGVLAQYSAGKVEYLVPQALVKGSPDDPAAVWKAAKIAFKQSSADKAGTEVPSDAFVAFLPGGLEELVRLCTDAQALALVGGKAKAAGTQMEWMSAVVRKYPNGPALAPIEQYLEGAMRTRYVAFENGTGGLDLLQQGLEFAKLSQAVYPNLPNQEKLRTELAERKAWLDRRIAILRALAVASQWDAYIIAARDFDRYRHAFPDAATQFQQALQESRQAHAKLAALRKQEGDYAGAYREFRAAAARKPSDSAVYEEAMQAWTEHSRRAAMEQQSRRTALGAGPRSTVERNLFFADQNRQAKKLDDAVKNVQEAEAVLKTALPAGAFSPESLKVLYMKAELLTAQERHAEALATLDAYDLLAVDEERTAADKLRNQLLFTMNTFLNNTRARIQSAWTEGNFAEAGRLAEQALRMKADDAEILYYAGMSAAVRRQSTQGRDLLTRYLEVSNTLDAKPEDRAKVVHLLPTLTAAPPPADGAANWLSGWKVPANTFYCPISVAFQPGIEHIEASGKLRVAFEWDNERLKSVTNAQEGGPSAGEKKIAFVYDDKVPQVIGASDDSGASKEAATLLRNNSQLDPIAVQSLTGRNVALGIAFNRFFNPFIWEKVYYFRLTYDEQGRVGSARELSGPKGSPGEQRLEFEWSGAQLMAIRGFLGSTKNYERTLQYQGGRLMSEEIQGQGKASRIRYTYAGNRLVSAETTNDTTLDNRSRKIAFRAGSASTVVK